MKLLHNSASKRTLALLVIGFLLAACRPWVEDVAKVIALIPLGVSRDEVRKVLVEAYGKKFPQSRQSYALTDSPTLVTASLIKADRDVLALWSRNGWYVKIYPVDLFDKVPTGARNDMIGLVAEAAHGNGYLTIYYDDKTNYIGFFACSTAKVH